MLLHGNNTVKLVITASSPIYLSAAVTYVTQMSLKSVTESAAWESQMKRCRAHHCYTTVIFEPIKCKLPPLQLKKKNIYIYRKKKEKNSSDHGLYFKIIKLAHWLLPKKCTIVNERYNKYEQKVHKQWPKNAQRLHKKFTNYTNQYKEYPKTFKKKKYANCFCPTGL